MDELPKAGMNRYWVVGGTAASQVASAYNSWMPRIFPRFRIGITQASDLEWTYISRAAPIESGDPTAKFRLGGTELLTVTPAQRRTSIEDYAIAALDEVERPLHARQQITAAY